jgi:DNA-binding MarR family transcriptional regulator
MATKTDRTLGALLSAHVAVTIETASRADDILAPFGLTMPLAHALWAIDPLEVPPTMKTLSGRLHCNASSLTFLIDRLSERGYVVRAESPTDRRTRTVGLTPTGLRVRGEVLEAVAGVSPLARLDEDDRERLLALLQAALGD